MLRVQGGSLRGQTFYLPPDIRPTSQFVREAIFNIVGDRVRAARVLELFAGSGALTFEALSRGAAQAVAVESQRRNTALIRKSAQKLGLEHVEVVPIRAETFLATGPALFDLILLDPPYDYPLGRLGGLSKWLALDGLLVAEYAERTKKPTWSDLDEITSKRYGDTRVGFYRPKASHTSR